MKKLSQLCINVNETNDNFVGVKYNKGNIQIIFPIGYDIPKDSEEDCRKSVINLFKIIGLAHEKNLDYEDGGDFLKDSEGLPVDSYMWVLTDYIENGLYSDNEKKYIQQQKGKINWKKTFRTKFLISNNSLIYLNPVVEQNSNIKNIITEIHSYCIDKSIDTIGSLYQGISKLNFIHPNIKRINYYIQLIDKEKLKTFDDRKKLLLYHLRRILVEQIDGGKNDIRNYGIRHFEHVWEYMVNKLFGDDNIKEYYPTTNYYLFDKDPYTPSKLRPDTIFVANNNFYIIDSKYYKYGITGNNKDLPGSDSIQKQVTYGEFINKNFNLDNKYDYIYNAFIMPYNKKTKPFDFGKKIEYCGYAICNWKLSKEYNNKYLKIAIILIDTKTLVDGYFDRGLLLKNELIEQIERVK